MWKALSRYLSALGYLFTGRIDKARAALETDPNVVRATYDDVIREKKGRIQEYMSAIATLIRQQESKKQEKERLEGELKRKEQVMAGAMSKAKKRLAALGGDQAAAKADAEFMKWQGAFTDAKTTVEEKRQRIAQLDQDIATAQQRIDKHKLGLETMQREIGKLKSEAGDAVARVISAKEEKEMADMLAGLSEDGTAERLSSIRDAVGQVEAEARVASELAGTDASATEAELLAEAAEDAAVDSFFAELSGGNTETEVTAPATPDAPERAIDA